jgi:hypothetical protein
MSFQVRSDIVASDFITEANINPVFQTLSDAQKLQIINSVCQQISDLYCSKAKPDYRADNMTATPLLSVIELNTITGYNSALGTDGLVIHFPSPFDILFNPDGDYYVDYHAVQGQDGSDVGLEVRKYPDRVEFYALADWVKLEYHIVPYSS